MTMQDVLEAQIDAAIKGLQRARTALAKSREDQEVTQHLETVSHHLQDIQFNWLNLSQRQASAGRWAAQ